MQRKIRTCAEFIIIISRNTSTNKVLLFLLREKLKTLPSTPPPIHVINCPSLFVYKKKWDPYTVA